MANISDSIYKIRLLDDLSDKKTWIHNIHPLSKLLATMVYIIAIISFDKYEIERLLPFIFYPMIIFIIGEIPLKVILDRMLIASFFVIGIGIFNPILDKTIALVIFNVPISSGWISFISLILKSMLTIASALLLLATTGMENIALSLRMLKVPKIFVLQLLITYRYILVLMEEVATIYNAYTLRAPGQKGINFKVWGSLAGQLLIRTFDRAQRVYQAMILRGFNGEYNTGFNNELSSRDYIYLLAWSIFFILSKYYNLPALLGAVIAGVIK
ncbi:cobalt ECF transporter T component CbiQ [Desnuesiella massiliensis]|uniref:cobalt ECF transporter T component CbiQ n=1 Tax=Desnuesiella massiliensis TaxID=1650662 RepID=UPI0006E19D18|nr:cobalt ECF transporter T component CbiQ [Desnuesiella massiliensis]